MRPPRPNAIVADGRHRILAGSAREAAFRMRARLRQRTAPLLERASLPARLMIRFRLWRFVQRQVARRAPPGALYSAREVSSSLWAVGIASSSSA